MGLGGDSGCVLRERRRPPPPPPAPGGGGGGGGRPEREEGDVARTRVRKT
jgi:hypothetical protein